ncbi:MAG: hypothetical protein M0042_09950 [Nitrospiraceae bacterium]|nr:hypothetical protein [Nitrospiraceae bacterium]
MKICHACNRELSLGREIGRKDECPFCNADLHCCRNCRFFDRAAPRQCREPQADLVRDKEKANFCDYFQFAERNAEAGGSAEADRTRTALDALFKK